MKKAFSTIFFLCTLSMFAQGPNNLIIESCTDRDVIANGTYTKAISTNGCDCYDRDGENGRIVWSQGSDGFFYESNKLCNDNESKVSAQFPIKNMNAECNNILAGSSSNTCIVVEAQNIPSLSQWAIIILSILMVILGVTAVFKKVRLAS
jgi:hypothetical protein